MNGTVVDDRMKIHTKLRHFAHALILLYLKTRRPEPSIDHHTYLSISLHALVLSLHSRDKNGKTCRFNLFRKL